MKREKSGEGVLGGLKQPSFDDEPDVPKCAGSTGQVLEYRKCVGDETTRNVLGDDCG